jgi:Legionella pneumophila major outer membrane protein precursor
MRLSTKVLMIALVGFGWGGLVQEVNGQYEDLRVSAVRRSVSDQSMNGAKTLPAIYPSSSIALEAHPAPFSTASLSTPSNSDKAVQLASYANQEFESHGFASCAPVYSSSNSCTSGKGCCEPCCEPWWAHSNSIFGESLYLWPGNSDLIYATEKTGTTSTDSPTGPLGITNVDESVGFRVGFSKRRTQCSSFFASYARWDGETTDSISTTNRVLISNLIHPSTTTVGSQSLTSSADQSISFQLVDAGFRRILRTTNCSAINWSAGLRYGNLEQGLVGRQIIQTATGLTTVSTDIDFDGVGILLGADGERRSQCCGGLIYGKLLGSLLAGDWRADFRQTNQFGGGVIANHFEDFRVTPVFDAELGFGWVSRSGAIKLTAGYLFSNWFNAISTRDYLRNVRSGALEDMADVLTFSGLTSRLELKF